MPSYNTGDQVIITSPTFGIYQGVIGSFVRYTIPASPKQAAVVTITIPSLGDINVWESDILPYTSSAQPLTSVKLNISFDTAVKPKDNDSVIPHPVKEQKFVDKDAMWDAIVSVASSKS